MALLVIPSLGWSQQDKAEDLLQRSAGADHGKGKQMSTDPTERVRGKFNKGRNERLTPEEKAQLREEVKQRGDWQKEYLEKLTKGDKQALKEFRAQMLERRRAKLATLTPEQRAALKANRKVSVQAAKTAVADTFGKDGKLTPEGRIRMWQHLESRRAALLKIVGKDPQDPAAVIEPADRDPVKVRKSALKRLIEKYHAPREEDSAPGQPAPGEPGSENWFTPEEQARIWADVNAGTVWD
jgi:hypothetical protein